MKRLSDRQREVLAALRRFAAHHGYMPTVRELAALIGVSSPCTAHRILEALRAKGVLSGRGRQMRLTAEDAHEDAAFAAFARLQSARGDEWLLAARRFHAGYYEGTALPVCLEWRGNHLWSVTCSGLILHSGGTWLPEPFSHCTEEFRQQTRWPLDEAWARAEAAIIGVQES